jgi:cell division protein FtsQ
MELLLATKFDNVKFINRISYLIGTIAVIIALFSIVLYIVENKFPVEHITVTGNINRVTKEQLVQVAGSNLHGTMFTLNIDELQYEFKRIPWVKSVNVSRTFPDSITVNIIEYNAVAHYGSDGEFVSPTGQVFLGVINDPTLPTFYGPESKLPDILKVYNVSIKNFSKRNIQIDNIYWLGAGLIKINFSNQLEAVVCGPDFNEKLLVLNQYWDNLYEINPGLNYVNMCYKNAVAINAIKKEKVVNK